MFKLEVSKFQKVNKKIKTSVIVEFIDIDK